MQKAIVKSKWRNAENLDLLAELHFPAEKKYFNYYKEYDPEMRIVCRQVKNPLPMRIAIKDLTFVAKSMGLSIGKRDDI